MFLDDSFSDNAIPEGREKTFKKWPFKRGPCVAKEMAKAGFYCVQNITAKCYYCGKELEGWESKDIPFLEHKTHAPKCCFVQAFDEPPSSLSIKQIVELEFARIMHKMESEKIKTIEKFDQFIAEPEKKKRRSRAKN